MRDSGLKREDVYITTKYSGVGGLDIETSITNSLKNVRGNALLRFPHVLMSCTAVGCQLCRSVPDPLSSPGGARHSYCVGTDGEGESGGEGKVRLITYYA